MASTGGVGSTSISSASPSFFCFSIAALPTLAKTMGLRPSRLAASGRFSPSPYWSYTPPHGHCRTISTRQPTSDTWEGSWLPSTRNPIIPEFAARGDFNATLMPFPSRREISPPLSGVRKAGALAKAGGIEAGDDEPREIRRAARPRQWPERSKEQASDPPSMKNRSERADGGLLQG